MQKSDKDFYLKLVLRFEKRFNQYEELIEAVNTMTDNINIIRSYNNKSLIDYVNFVDKAVLPKYNKKQVDSNITDVIMLIAGIESQIKKIIDHKNSILQELTGSSG